MSLNHCGNLLHFCVTPKWPTGIALPLASVLGRSGPAGELAGTGAADIGEAGPALESHLTGIFVKPVMPAIRPRPL